VVLVEGVSDKVVLETLALRRGRDLAAEGVSVLPVGGAQAIGRFLNLYRPAGSNVGLAGLCDAAAARSQVASPELTGPS
jgi:predicted ATP-dependent endonuclease of OLD family